ncbi:2-dehydropantoate 2-reductase N-terminal domain-containing protein [Salinicoccus siamensis]|uniref:6-phosphogluconate dehydrogenase, decarboxylating n=1 Tax=Salinicoccus siamensis TaxID=381830 RepID=A0ABV5Z6K6_9STAP
MKIAVIGIGAVGSVIARELKMLDYDTVLFGRQPKSGFTISEAGEEHSYPYRIETMDAYQGGSFDVVFVAVKATALRGISQTFHHLINEETEVILCENGMGYEHYFDRPVPAVVYISGQKKNDRIEHFQDATLLIEDTSRPNIDRLITALDKHPETQLEIKKSEDFERIRYEKLLINLGINSVTALSKNTSKIFELESVAQLTRAILEEGVAIVNSEREIVSPEFVDRAMAIYKNYNPEMGTSMYYDVMADVKTEYAYIQKHLHDRKGPLETPVLDVIVTLLEAYQYKRGY